MIRGYADHAANERTFVARTVIAVIAFGFGQAKFNIFAARVTSTALGNSEQSLEFANIRIRRSVPSSRLLVPQFSAYGSSGPLGCSTILGALRDERTRPLPPVFAECYGDFTRGDRGGIICKGTRLHAPPLQPG